jgi:hypothetical protein
LRSQIAPSTRTSGKHTFLKSEERATRFASCWTGARWRSTVLKRASRKTVVRAERLIRSWRPVGGRRLPTSVSRITVRFPFEQPASHLAVVAQSERRWGRAGLALKGGSEDEPLSQAPRNAGQALKCECCHAPMTRVRAAIVGLRQRRLFFLCMRCGAVRTPLSATSRQIAPPGLDRVCAYSPRRVERAPGRCCRRGLAYVQRPYRRREESRQE